MKIAYFSPSYKRPEGTTTQKIFPVFDMLVHEDEVEEYKSNGIRCISLPNEIKGNIARVKNYILDKYLDDYDCILMADDDISKVVRWQGGETLEYNNNELQEFTEQSTMMCLEWGFKMWGVNPLSDKGSYREYTPFSTKNYMSSSFIAHVKGSEVRYDENFPLKEDYDIVLQHCLKYGGCLRFNMVNFYAKQSEQEGGCATYRNLDREKQQFFALQKKWGKDVIVRDTGSKRSFDYNPVLKVPLKGV